MQFESMRFTVVSSSVKKTVFSIEAFKTSKVILITTTRKKGRGGGTLLNTKCRQYLRLACREAGVAAFSPQRRCPEDPLCTLCDRRGEVVSQYFIKMVLV